MLNKFYSALKKLIPFRRRQQLSALRRLFVTNRSALWAVLIWVKPRSVGEILCFIEAPDGHGTGTTEIYVYGLKTPLVLRNSTSDFRVFRQVFIDQQYGFAAEANAEYIVDAGANVGLASLFFLLTNKRSQVIAVEPDPHNYAVAEKNLRGFEDRCRLVKAAVWSKSTVLALRRGEFADGGYWASQTVLPQNSSEVLVDAYTINDLTRSNGFSRIDILKIDIEGAELEVFRDGDVSFLAFTRVCAIECHGPDCSEVFLSAAQSYGFLARSSGELLIAIRAEARCDGYGECSK